MVLLTTIKSTTQNKNKNEYIFREINVVNFNLDRIVWVLSFAIQFNMRKNNKIEFIFLSGLEFRPYSKLVMILQQELNTYYGAVTIL